MTDALLQALLEGSLAQPQLPDASSPRHGHLQRLVQQLTQERDDCQARLNQLQAWSLSLYHGLTFSGVFPSLHVVGCLGRCRLWGLFMLTGHACGLADLNKTGVVEYA